MGTPAAISLQEGEPIWSKGNVPGDGDDVEGIVSPAAQVDDIGPVRESRPRKGMLRVRMKLVGEATVHRFDGDGRAQQAGL
jgi:hypothetical protein